MAFVNMNQTKEESVITPVREKPTFRMSNNLTSCMTLCGRERPCGNSHCSNYRGYKKTSANQ